jgi:hypothetical protein
MYEVVFCSSSDQPNLNSAGVSLEDKNFSTTLDDSPSDRHAYKLKCFTNPLAIGRLPISAKNFYKFCR